jgi:hypothetical protein
MFLSDVFRVNVSCRFLRWFLPFKTWLCELPVGTEKLCGNYRKVRLRFHTVLLVNGPN